METTSYAELPEPPPNLPLENGGGPRHESDDRCAKKPKVEDDSSNAASGGGDGGAGELKRVAEIVLVLSTMAAMRAGRKPTDVEVELMREARTKLAELCEGLAPKDIVAREAIGTVIEDLGLNGKVKDQKLGFRTPKMSIAERFAHTKLKMDEAKKFSAPSTTYASQPLQTGVGVTADNRVPPHGTRMFAPDKPSYTGVSSSGNMVSIPAHVSSGTSSMLQYQPTSNEVRPPMVSGVMAKNQLGRNSASLALPKVEHPQFKVDGGSNGSSHMLQVQANSSAIQPLVSAPTWSIQTQSASLARSSSESKVPAYNPIKLEGTSGVAVSRTGPQKATDQSLRPFIPQTTAGNLPSMHQQLQSMSVVQPPSIPSHADIAKVVQKLLLPKLPEHPTWTPPSRDYMNKALTCQMCELTVNEIDTVLICDACEKGYHLKCLQPTVLRGIHNRVDWHCVRCLTSSGGRPLPPKYGRVMRSSTAPPKLPSNQGAIQQSSEKKAGSMDPKASQQKLTTNGSSVPTVAANNVKIEPPSDLKTPDTKDIQGTSISSAIRNIDEKPDPSVSVKSITVASTPIGLPGECSAQQINSEPSTSKESMESKVLPKLSEPGKCENLQSSQDFQVETAMSQDGAAVSSDKQVDSVLMNRNKEETHAGENLMYDIKRDGQDVSLANIGGGSATDPEDRQHSALSSDTSRAVESIGDVLQVVDEKKFYQSFCVDGVTYRLQGHALFPSSQGKLVPSKLQSMWEDCKTGLKWVKVTNCYFPGDLPGNIGHPCISEVNEVYESNSDRTEMASAIRGPCLVLPSDKFEQENDRRSQLGVEAFATVQSIFLCRWFYDEVKKLFQPVTS